MDFKQLDLKNRRYNFHSHTQFCDGHAPMEAFAAAASAAGFSHYGFSPHSPVPIESPCNMSHDDVGAYLSEVDRLKGLYGSGTQFYASMEIDFLGPQWGPSSAYFDSLPLDYRIGSVHFIPSQDGELVDIDGRFESFRRKMSRNFRNDIRYVVNTFFDQSLEMLSRGGLDIIGHYDKVSHNASHFHPGLEQEGWYVDRLNGLTDEIIKSGVAVEINTKQWTDHHRMFPAIVMWRRLIDSGVTILVNSDAHYPELIDASRKLAFLMLDSLENR